MQLLVACACALAGPASAQDAARPRIEPALARAFADTAAASDAMRRQASSPRARAGELRVIVEPPRGRRARDLPLERIRALGARVDGIARSRVRITGSPAVLARVAEIEGIGELRFPLVPVPVEGAGLHLSESIGLVGATAFQNGGITGSGVDVAVLDIGFWRLAEAKGTGDIPLNAIPVDLVGAGIEAETSHGTAVAEQVADIAPGARLHLILFDDEVDFEQAVDYVRDNDIRIANLSVNWFGASYYDDTGPINTLINESYDQDGVFWTVGAGNWAYRHWRGNGLDADLDRWLEFAPGDEQLGLVPETTAQTCLTLNWNQYQHFDPPTDLDLYVYRGAGIAVTSSTVRQVAGVKPVEQVCFMSQTGQTYYARVWRLAGSLTGTNLTAVSSNITIAADNRIAASSMVDPAVAHGAFAVGAVDFAQWLLPTPPIESLSSRGPTNDGRMKPEIVAPDRTDSLARPGMPGTSFAAPVVAGAAALMLAQNSTLSNLQLRSALIAAAQDVAPAGQDASFGWGKLVVPAVPAGPDADGDGIQDAFDVCPFTPDANQLDADSDGIGNACQCGDLSADGFVDLADTNLLQAFVAGTVPTPAGLALCNVVGTTLAAGADCRIDDWVVLSRSLGDAPPGVAQVCSPALPP